jgi:signal transduction histidine kinase
MESQKGAIEVNLANTRLDSSFGHQEIRAGKYLQLTVKDTGHGMKPEVMDRIFEPFFTTRRTGTGLGLAISRNIARAHGGDLTLSRNEADGVQFTFWIPAD